MSGISRIDFNADLIVPSREVNAALFKKLYVDGVNRIRRIRYGNDAIPYVPSPKYDGVSTSNSIEDKPVKENMWKKIYNILDSNRTADLTPVQYVRVLFSAMEQWYFIPPTLPQLPSDATREYVQYSLNKASQTIAARMSTDAKNMTTAVNINHKGYGHCFMRSVFAACVSPGQSFSPVFIFAFLDRLINENARTKMSEENKKFYKLLIGLRDEARKNAMMDYLAFRSAYDAVYDNTIPKSLTTMADEQVA